MGNVSLLLGHVRSNAVLTFAVRLHCHVLFLSGLSPSPYSGHIALDCCHLLTSCRPSCCNKLALICNALSAFVSNCICELAERSRAARTAASACCFRWLSSGPSHHCLLPQRLGRGKLAPGSIHLLCELLCHRCMYCGIFSFLGMFLKEISVQCLARWSPCLGI